MLIEWPNNLKAILNMNNIYKKEEAVWYKQPLLKMITNV